MSKFPDQATMICAHIEDMKLMTDGSSCEVVHLAMSTLLLTLLVSVNHDKFRTLKALSVLVDTAQKEINSEFIHTLVVH